MTRISSILQQRVNRDASRPPKSPDLPATWLWFSFFQLLFLPSFAVVSCICDSSGTRGGEFEMPARRCSLRPVVQLTCQNSISSHHSSSARCKKLQPTIQLSQLLLDRLRPLLLLALVTLPLSAIPLAQTQHRRLAHFGISCEKGLQIVRLHNRTEVDVVLVLHAVFRLCLAVGCAHEHRQQ